MTFDTIKKWCRHSLTIAWSYLLLAVGAIIAVIPRAVDLILDPNVGGAVQSQIPAHWVGIYTIGIAVLTYGARMRSLAK